MLLFVQMCSLFSDFANSCKNFKITAFYFFLKLKQVCSKSNEGVLYKGSDPNDVKCLF